MEGGAIDGDLHRGAVPWAGVVEDLGIRGGMGRETGKGNGARCSEEAIGGEPGESLVDPGIPLRHFHKQVAVYKPTTIVVQ